MEKFDTISHPPFLRFERFELYAARGRVLIYFSVRGRATEQSIIFRFPTPGQGIIFVKIGSMTGSIFDSGRSF